MRAFWPVGISLVVVALAVPNDCRADLIINGGFETGDFTGWTQSGDTRGTAVVRDGTVFMGSLVTVHSGIYAAAYGPPSLGFLSQSLPTVAGSTYELIFFLRNDNLGPPPDNEFHVFWGGSEVFTLTPNAGTFDYTEIKIADLLATGPSTELRFGIRNRPGGFFLDDVSVNAIPEPSTLALFGAGVASLLILRRRLGAA